jgi:hypothetical protein
MITLVTGLPRSGTSMMMRILEAGGLPPLTDGLRAADRDNPNGYYEFEPVKETARDAAWLVQAEGRAVKLVYLLLRDLPLDRPYRVVFMQRALKEVVASQAAMLERLGRRPGGPGDPHALVASFAAEIASTKAWLAATPCFRVIYLNYNRLLADPRPHLSDLQTFLAHEDAPPLDLDAMCGVVDPALYRQRGDHR